MGDLFYREQEGPADSEVKQPGDNVDYSADGPRTWKKDPQNDRGIPPGNPGFVNLPERDSMNPSSGKVIPESMGETLRNQLTYVNTASAARVAARYAARPVRLPMGEIKDLAQKLAHRLHSWGLPKPGRVIAQEWFHLPNVFGDEVEVEILLAGSPQSDPFNQELIHGGFLKKRPEGPLITIFVNPHQTSFKRWPVRVTEEEIYRILSHELTHAADIWAGKGSGQHADKSKDEFKRHHHNHPAEVRALMRDVVTTAESSLQDFLDAGMPFSEALRYALEDSKWTDIEPYLTPENRKTILKGVYTYFEDQGWTTRTARQKSAALIQDIFAKTGPDVHQRSKGLQVQQRRFVPERGFWSFMVTGSSGKPYYVRIKGIRKSKSILQLSKADVRVSCSCPFWRWQGPEHWGKVNAFLYGKPRGTASFPIIRDPKEKHWACKHLLAALETARGYRFASEGERWSLDGPLAPLLEPDPQWVSRRYAGMSPVESAALSLMQDSEEGLDDLIEMVRGSRYLFDPVSRQRVEGRDVAEALEKMRPRPLPGGFKVYHATTPQFARLLLKRGFIPSLKPAPLGGASYAPGRGLDPGLYVGASSRAVEGYGRVTLEIQVPKRALSVPTELAQLGETDPMSALRSHDGAVIYSAIPPEAIRVVEGSQYLRG